MVPIGITGAMGAGKDTFAAVLARHGGIFEVMAIADPIRQIATDIFGFTRDQLTDRALKEAQDPRWGITPRRFLQLVGCEMFRDQFRDDVWVRLLERRMLAAMAAGRAPVVPDIRFPGEIKLIRDMGGCLVHVERPGGQGPAESMAHRSEHSLGPGVEDIKITNDGSLEEYEARVLVDYMPVIITCCQQPGPEVRT